MIYMFKKEKEKTKMKTSTCPCHRVVPDEPNPQSNLQGTEFYFICWTIPFIYIKYWKLLLNYFYDNLSCLINIQCKNGPKFGRFAEKTCLYSVVAVLAGIWVDDI